MTDQITYSQEVIEDELVKILTKVYFHKKEGKFFDVIQAIETHHMATLLRKKLDEIAYELDFMDFFGSAKGITPNATNQDGI